MHVCATCRLPCPSQTKSPANTIPANGDLHSTSAGAAAAFGRGGSSPSDIILHDRWAATEPSAASSQRAVRQLAARSSAPRASGLQIGFRGRDEDRSAPFTVASGAFAIGLLYRPGASDSCPFCFAVPSSRVSVLCTLLHVRLKEPSAAPSRVNSTLPWRTWRPRRRGVPPLAEHPPSGSLRASRTPLLPGVLARSRAAPWLRPPRARRGASSRG